MIQQEIFDIRPHDAYEQLSSVLEDRWYVTLFFY